MSTSRIRNINPAALGPAVGFSHVTIASGLVWLGGQIGCNTDGVVESPGNIAAQFDRAIRNVGTALREVGTAPENAVKLTYFVTDLEAYRAARREIGRSYRAVFAKHYPATSLFEVKSLFEPHAMVEIECVALEAERGG